MTGLGPGPTLVGNGSGVPANSGVDDRGELFRQAGSALESLRLSGRTIDASLFLGSWNIMRRLWIFVKFGGQGMSSLQ